MAGKAAQDFVPVREVRNGTLIMKDGGLRAVLMASSVNLALKSDIEQDAIIGAFQTFLNTLDFSVQIVVQSRELDVRPYLALLDQRQEMQKSDLMRLQTREYRNFVERFVDQTNIMRKHFYVIVPYTPVLGNPISGGVSLPFLSKDKGPQGATEAFEQQRQQLAQRVAVVSQGLAAAGIRSAELDTEAVLELLYRSFNPGVFETPIQQQA